MEEIGSIEVVPALLGDSLCETCHSAGKEQALAF